MALTQAAILPGPSWDEEVVPALRKRLQSESRTLSKRMSAISLSEADESPYPNYDDFTVRQKSSVSPGSQSSSRRGGTRLQLAYQQPDRMSSTATPRVNGSSADSSSSAKNQKPSSSEFQRSRTYSQPFTTDLPNGNARPKPTTAKSYDATRALSPRPADLKPTRIPVASRVSLSSNGHSPPPLPSNGYSPYSPTQQFYPESTRILPTTVRLMNESPPFSSTSSINYSQNGHEEYENAPPRHSNDSEERPFEHWYRGEVSRNGGVGELRVGRRQEMLEIANYGHTLAKKKKLASKAVNHAEDYRRHRKRADSIAGITIKEREQESLYLDDEHVNEDEVGQVLDESPLTDLDGEMSDLASNTSSHRRSGYDHIPGVGDISTTVSDRSVTTKIPPLPALQQRPQQNGHYPHPTRIPGPSSRRSSESRVSTPTLNTSRGTNNSAGSPSPPPQAPAQQTPPTKQAGAQPQMSVNKRGVSPASASASKKSRTAASKATRAKTTAARKEQEDLANRKSVAYYPSPGSEGDDDMADAIPSWTQPKLKEGNWDEVVLPVVARKKGLDDQYEKADGGPQLKKADNTIAPAPGTFGYDHSKYRPPRDGESIPMDEFGRQEDPVDEYEQTGDKFEEQTLPDESRLPKWRASPPSPAPFSQYAPPRDKKTTILPANPVNSEVDRIPQHMEEEKGAGCCAGCVVM